MPIRFTEFIKNQEKDIALYIIEQDMQISASIFEIRIIDGETIKLNLSRNSENNWEIQSNNIPSWVLDFIPTITDIISRKINLITDSYKN